MTITPESTSPSHERRLGELGLSSAIVHDGLRRGATRANNRTARALASSGGTDIYHDAMEDFHRLLGADRWFLDEVDGQPRIFHPEGLVSFTVSSGINVGQKKMRTRKKGPATRRSLALPAFVPSLFPEIDAELLEKRAARAKQAPFYLLVVERSSQGGNGLLIELAQPAEMSDGNSVTAWGERIRVKYLDLGGDLSAFTTPSDAPDDEFDVPVTPR
jgi:hypothetical protein